jgi:hypothetical protein
MGYYSFIEIFKTSPCLYVIFFNGEGEAKNAPKSRSVLLLAGRAGFEPAAEF